MTFTSTFIHIPWASQVVLVAKSPPSNTGEEGDVGLIPGLGRSPGGGHGNPLQYSWLENSWTEEPGGVQSMGLQESDMTEQVRMSMS